MRIARNIHLCLILLYKHCSSLFNQSETTLESRQSWKYTGNLLCNGIKFSNQWPWRFSGPEAFQFGIFLNTLMILLFVKSILSTYPSKMYVAPQNLEFNISDFIHHYLIVEKNARFCWYCLTRELNCLILHRTRTLYFLFSLSLCLFLMFLFSSKMFT